MSNYILLFYMDLMLCSLNILEWMSIAYICSYYKYFVFVYPLTMFGSPLCVVVPRVFSDFSSIFFGQSQNLYCNFCPQNNRDELRYYEY